jgi:hypothetical protein
VDLCGSWREVVDGTSLEGTWLLERVESVSLGDPENLWISGNLNLQNKGSIEVGDREKGRE